MSTFYERFERRRSHLRSVLCVGLDPVTEKIPENYSKDGGVLAFLSDIIQATSDFCVAYKPNLAFFEASGADGMKLFEKTLQMIRERAPQALIIADAKRGDIPDTAYYYARAFFETYDCDAITLSPYMGMDTLSPFTAYREKASVVLCLTSNADAERFQNLGSPPLFEQVALETQKQQLITGNLWLVVGATRDPARIGQIRRVAPDVPFLIPGVGAQGGDMKSVLSAAGRNVLINASRSILYATKDRKDVPATARKSAETLVEEMRACGI